MMLAKGGYAGLELPGLTVASRILLEGEVSEGGAQLPLRTKATRPEEVAAAAGKDPFKVFD